MSEKFKVISKYEPAGDQTQAIAKLSQGLKEGQKFQTLLGVTGSGKTYTMAKVIEEIQKPTLVLTHNKTLAAQLYREFKEFFPNNCVEYFVSYYDYYQPEAYVVNKDLYIEKDASLNDEIDRLRLLATSSLLERKDVIVVSSVSCIYGLGMPENFEKMHLSLRCGDEIDRDQLLKQLVEIHYSRNDINFMRGTFRVRGDVVEIYPAYLQEGFRLEFFGDEIESISRIDPTSMRVKEKIDWTYVYPAKHFVTPREELEETLGEIESELEARVIQLKAENKLVEAQRLDSRTRYDLEMLLETGYCNGIENYSRYMSHRQPGERPACLLDYFKKNFLLMVDESHVSLPQVGGMFNGDRARKQNLVDYGFRLPSALDNRPLKFEEFIAMLDQAIFVSATPADFELEKSSQIAEQIIRPTGLLDPQIEVRPAEFQVDNLITEVQQCVKNHERVLVTTLTKKMAENLSEYFETAGIKARYLHSEIETIERVEIIKDLRKGVFDCLIGINLLREGLDIPEVSLVAILDADKEGFLRSARSLIQTSGRAARNVNGRVIMYADKMTPSMKQTIEETERRRAIQEKYNRDHHITPTTISKDITDILEREYLPAEEQKARVAEIKAEYKTHKNNYEQLQDFITTLKEEMLEAADNLEFEKAALIRDQIKEMEKRLEMLQKIN